MQDSLWLFQRRDLKLLHEPTTSLGHQLLGPDEETSSFVCIYKTLKKYLPRAFSTFGKVLMNI